MWKWNIIMVTFSSTWPSWFRANPPSYLLKCSQQYVRMTQVFCKDTREIFTWMSSSFTERKHPSSPSPSSTTACTTMGKISLSTSKRSWGEKMLLPSSRNRSQRSRVEASGIAWVSRNERHTSSSAHSLRLTVCEGKQNCWHTPLLKCTVSDCRELSCGK